MLIVVTSISEIPLAVSNYVRIVGTKQSNNSTERFS